MPSIDYGATHKHLHERKTQQQQFMRKWVGWRDWETLTIHATKNSKAFLRG